MRRALVILAALLTAAALPAAASAGGYSTYWGSGELTQLTVRKQVVVEPGPQGIFWATQIWFAGGDGGYFGMQANRAVDGGRREQKTFIFSLWGTDQGKTSNAEAWCGQWQNEGEGGAGFGSTCRTLFDWKQGRTYRFDLRETSPHWWTVSVREEETGHTFVLGSIHTPSSWGKLSSGVMSWDEEYAGNYPYAKVRTSFPTGNNGTVKLKETSIDEHPGAKVTCDASWCTHEIGVSQRPAATPPPRPVTVKPAGDLAAHRPATASSSVGGTDARRAALAVDSSAASSWRTSGSGSQWWQVDLGSPAELHELTVDWDHYDVPSAYTVMTSTDARTWTTLVRAGRPGGGPVHHDLTGSARYVRIGLTVPGAAAIWDVQIFGVRPSPSPSTAASVSPTPAASPSAPATTAPLPATGRTESATIPIDRAAQTSPDGTVSAAWPLVITGGLLLAAAGTRLLIKLLGARPARHARRSDSPRHR